MDLDLDEIDRGMRFLPSHAITISCGTVTIDPDESKVLLIWNKRLEIYQLPKGRKDIGEDLLSAAVRETREETGVTPTPLRLKIATRSTLSAHDMTKEEREARCGVIEGRFSHEFVGCCSYPDPQSATPALKIVFFFVATADSTAPNAGGSPEDRERLEGVWVKASDAARTLRFKAESGIVEKALVDARNSGYPLDA